MKRPYAPLRNETVVAAAADVLKKRVDPTEYESFFTSVLLQGYRIAAASGDVSDREADILNALARDAGIGRDAFDRARERWREEGDRPDAG
jgi:hypothetical protein